MNWKEQAKKIRPSHFEHFISTEIIEKLIADIPEYEECCGHPQYDRKQQLRDKWL